MSDTPKNIQEVTKFILERRKLAAAAAVKDPDEKGTPATPGNPDAAKTEESLPGTGEQTSNTGKKPDMTDTGLLEGGTPAPVSKTVVNEPEAPGMKAAKAIRNILKEITAVPAKEAAAEPVAAEPAKEAAAAEPVKTEEPAKAEVPAVKKADDVKIVDMDESIVVKLAKCISGNEARASQVQEWLEEDYGREQAMALVKFAHMADEEIAQLQQQEAANAALIKEASDLYQSLSPEEQAKLDKLAAVRITLIEGKSENEIAAFDLGMKQAAMVADNGGEMPPAEAEPSIEEIIALLEQMVASGEITEEEAAQVAQELMGEMGAGEGMPEEVKQASADIIKIAATIAA